jgi:hypothetical protein
MPTLIAGSKFPVKWNFPFVDIRPYPSASSCNVSLLVPGEIHALTALHRQRRDPVHLINFDEDVSAGHVVFDPSLDPQLC